MKLIQKAASKIQMKNAFTLAEVMATVAIIGILAAVAFGGGLNFIRQAENMTERQAVQALEHRAKQVLTGKKARDLTDLGAQKVGGTEASGIRFTSNIPYDAAFLRASHSIRPQAVMLADESGTYYIFSSALNDNNDGIIEKLGGVIANQSIAWVILCEMVNGGAQVNKVACISQDKMTALVGNTTDAENIALALYTAINDSKSLFVFPSDAETSAAGDNTGSGGGGDTPNPTDTPTPTPTPGTVTCTVTTDNADATNQDELSVTVKADLSKILVGSNENATPLVKFNVIVKGVESGATYQRVIPCGKPENNAASIVNDTSTDGTDHHYYQYYAPTSAPTAWDESGITNCTQCWDDLGKTMTMRVVLDSNLVTDGAKERPTFNTLANMTPLLASSKWDGENKDQDFTTGEEWKIAVYANIELTNGEPKTYYQSKISDTLTLNPLYYPRTAHANKETDGIDYDLTIKHARQLQNLALDASKTTTKYAVKLDDSINETGIDLNGAAFTPISNPRIMTFDGANKPIKNLVTINAEVAAGLFGVFSGSKIENVQLYMDDESLIKNLKDNITDRTTGNPTSAETDNTIKYANVSAVGTDKRYAGGIVGHAIGEKLEIKNSFAALVVKADTGNTGIAGGLVGKADGALTVTDSYADCYIQGGIIGGLAGQCNTGSAFTNCYSAGFPLLTGDNASTATVAGITTSAATINNCWSAFYFEDITISKTTESIYAFTNGGSVDEQSHYSYYGAQTDSDTSENKGTYQKLSETTVSATPYNLATNGLTNFRQIFTTAWTLPHYGDWKENPEPEESTTP